MTVRRVLLSAAWVMKTRSPQTIGEELPPSGSATFQRTFSFAPHLSGASVSDEWPLPCGPRHAGQLSASAEGERQRSAPRAGRRRGMTDLALFDLTPNL